jgi:hyperosmotically inducible protein
VLKASDGKSIDINIDTQDGVVHLTGFAPSNSDIDSAVEIARRVEGVKDVRHKLAVKPG